MDITEVEIRFQGEKCEYIYGKWSLSYINEMFIHEY